MPDYEDPSQEALIQRLRAVEALSRGKDADGCASRDGRPRLVEIEDL